MNLRANSSLPPRIVIIDDDPAFCEVLARMVGALGYEIIIKSDSSASHTYELRDSDIVLVDVLMPNVSGFQILEQLDRQQVKSDFVLMSGHGEFLDKAEALAKNLNLSLLGVLEKPFRLPDIKEVLASA